MILAILAACTPEEGVIRMEEGAPFRPADVTLAECDAEDGTRMVTLAIGSDLRSQRCTSGEDGYRFHDSCEGALEILAELPANCTPGDIALFGGFGTSLASQFLPGIPDAAIWQGDCLVDGTLEVGIVGLASYVRDPEAPDTAEVTLVDADKPDETWTLPARYCGIP